MLAYSLAERATAAGLRTMVLDFDPNEGPLALATLRGDGLSSWCTESISLTASGLRTLERYLKSSDQDFLICDLPGADSTLFYVCWAALIWSCRRWALGFRTCSWLLSLRRRCSVSSCRDGLWETHFRTAGLVGWALPRSCSPTITSASARFRSSAESRMLTPLGVGSAPVSGSLGGRRLVKLTSCGGGSRSGWS